MSLSRIDRFGLAACVVLLSQTWAWGQRPAPAAGERGLPGNIMLERDIEYGKAGDRGLKLDLMRPKGQGDKRLPVVAFVHGGGWRAGSKERGLPRLIPIVASGKFVCVSIGYRLSSEAIWPAQIHDCKAAIRWLRAHADEYRLDAEHIGVWGTSAGGHLVSLLGTSGDVPELEGAGGNPGHSSRVACVVDYCGPSAFLAFSAQSPRMRNPDSPLVKLFGGPLAEKQVEAKAASPVTHASAGDPPFLIVHGDKDNTVPIQQAEMLETVLKKAGVDVTLICMEGGGHGIGGPEIARRVSDFFDKHLRGEQETISTEPIRVTGGGK